MSAPRRCGYASLYADGEEIRASEDDDKRISTKSIRHMSAWMGHVHGPLSEKFDLVITSNAFGGGSIETNIVVKEKKTGKSLAVISREFYTAEDKFSIGAIANITGGPLEFGGETPENGVRIGILNLLYDAEANFIRNTGVGVTGTFVSKTTRDKFLERHPTARLTSRKTWALDENKNAKYVGVAGAALLEKDLYNRYTEEKYAEIAIHLGGYDPRVSLGRAGIPYSEVARQAELALLKEQLLLDDSEIERTDAPAELSQGRGAKEAGYRRDRQDRGVEEINFGFDWGRSDDVDRLVEVVDVDRNSLLRGVRFQRYGPPSRLAFAKFYPEFRLFFRYIPAAPICQPQIPAEKSSLGQNPPNPDAMHPALRVGHSFNSV